MTKSISTAWHNAVSLMDFHDSTIMHYQSSHVSFMVLHPCKSLMDSMH